MQLLDLPTELLIEILRQLEFREVLRAQLVCLVMIVATVPPTSHI